ncbi:MAG TPA: MerR family transcriptional regulator [Actinomycetota bacterium]|nr:MerR family transcriptional regulator [Actinomycetota bacterium]
MDGYRISDVAGRTGFSPSAVRYYEKIGLIPSPERTPSGYRVFGDEHVRLLEFIARAKHLGLPLEEIRVLAEAWRKEDCRATREQLLRLLDAKLAQVRHLIGDMVRFRDQLEEVYGGLADRPASLRCGPACGCEVDVGRVDVEAARELTLVGLGSRTGAG